MSANKSQREKLPSPTQSSVARWAERDAAQPSHPAVHKGGQQPAGCSADFLQDEAGQTFAILHLQQITEGLQPLKNSYASGHLLSRGFGFPFTSCVVCFLCLCNLSTVHAGHELVTWTHLCYFNVSPVQAKNELRSSILLGVALDGVYIYQVGRLWSLHTFIMRMKVILTNSVKH